MSQPPSSLTRWAVAGVLAGLATDAIADGFLDVDPTFSTIDAPGASGNGPPFTRAIGINNAGQIVGVFANGMEPQQGFLDVGGTFSTIHVRSAVHTAATGINNAGQIVGYFQDSKGQHGFLDVSGTFSTESSPWTDSLCSAKEPAGGHAE